MSFFEEAQTVHGNESTPLDVAPILPRQPGIFGLPHLVERIAQVTQYCSFNDFSVEMRFRIDGVKHGAYESGIG